MALGTAQVEEEIERELYGVRHRTRTGASVKPEALQACVKACTTMR
jgi:hypothetical protein